VEGSSEPAAVPASIQATNPGSQEPEAIMGSKKTATAAAVGVAAAAAAGTIAARRTGGPDAEELRRWRVVTVARGLEEIAGTTPSPLASLGDAVDVQMTPAPADRGTELRARWRDGAPPSSVDDPLEALRVALRESKQLLEVGWVLQPDRNGTAQATVLNVPLRRAIKVARGKGLL
jgi:hypothetical protein